MNLFNSIILAVILTMLLGDSDASTRSQLKSNKLQRQLMRGFQFYKGDKNSDEEKMNEETEEELVKSDAEFLAKSPNFLRKNTMNFPRRMRIKDPRNARRSNPFRSLRANALKMFIN